MPADLSPERVKELLGACEKVLRTGKDTVYETRTIAYALRELLSQPERGEKIDIGDNFTLRDLDRTRPFERAKYYRVSGDTIVDTLEGFALLEAENHALKRMLATPPPEPPKRP